MKKVSAEQIEKIEKKGITIEREESGKKLSTFLSGGLINFVVYPKTEDELIFALDVLRGSNFHLLGFGSNTLISDEGVNLVLTTRRMKGYSLSGLTLRANAGESLNNLSLFASSNGLHGMEFLVGIPGSVGGAVTMNAGAMGSEIKDILKSVKLYKDGKVFKSSPEDIELSYRHSNLDGAIVLECEFCLSPSLPRECKKQMESFFARRKATQPLEPSLGSVFKRTNGVSPAQYIELLQMKGESVKGAVLSEKHCNFIVNRGGATSSDYEELMEKIRERAKAELGVELEPEIRIIKD